MLVACSCTVKKNSEELLVEKEWPRTIKCVNKLLLKADKRDSVIKTLYAMSPDQEIMHETDQERTSRDRWISAKVKAWSSVENLQAWLNEYYRDNVIGRGRPFGVISRQPLDAERKHRDTSGDWHMKEEKRGKVPKALAKVKQPSVTVERYKESFLNRHFPDLVHAEITGYCVESEPGWLVYQVEKGKDQTISGTQIIKRPGEKSECNGRRVYFDRHQSLVLEQDISAPTLWFKKSYKRTFTKDYKIQSYILGKSMLILKRPHSFEIWLLDQEKKWWDETKCPNSMNQERWNVQTKVSDNPYVYDEKENCSCFVKIITEFDKEISWGLYDDKASGKERLVLISFPASEKLTLSKLKGKAVVNEGPQWLIIDGSIFDFTVLNQNQVQFSADGRQFKLVKQEANGATTNYVYTIEYCGSRENTSFRVSPKDFLNH